MREIRLFLVIFAFVALSFGLWKEPSFAQAVECKKDLFVGSVVANVNGGAVSLSQNGITMGETGETIETSGIAGIVSILSPETEKVNVELTATYLYGDGKDVKVRNVTYGGVSSFETNVDAGVEKFINVGASVEYSPAQKIGNYNGVWTVSADFDKSKIHVSEVCPMSINFNARDILLSEVKPLNFGTVSKQANGGGIIRVGFDGSRTVVSGNMQFLSSVSNAEFEVEASPETTVYVSFEKGFLYGEKGSVRVENFTSSKGNSFNIPATGKTSVKVGADLVIDSNQPEGNYSGTYDIIVNY